MIGVLALQGGYQKHLEVLLKLGAKAHLVRCATELEHCSALVLPGGESTSMTWLMERLGLFEAVYQAAQHLPVFATCAGLILLGKGVKDSRVKQMELLDVTVQRNGYGTQIDSFKGEVELNDGSTTPGIFIRAPKIIGVGAGVKVLGSRQGQPVLVQQGTIMAATFHPELGDDFRIHAHFLKNLHPSKNTPEKMRIQQH